MPKSGFAAKKVKVYCRVANPGDTGEKMIKDLAPPWPLGDRLYREDSLVIETKGIWGSRCY